MKKASLSDIKKMKENNELFYDPDAPIGESLGIDFWKEAFVNAIREFGIEKFKETSMFLSNEKRNEQ